MERHSGDNPLAQDFRAMNNAHLLDPIEGVEYQVELIGSEAVVTNFSEPWESLVRLTGAAMNDPEAMRQDDWRRVTQPDPILFSFPAGEELRRLVFAASRWFDEHGETANEEMDRRIQALVEPEVRAWLARDQRRPG